MRLQIYGISKLGLFCVGLLPLLIWSGFHIDNFAYFDFNLAANCLAGVLVALAFVVYFLKGMFISRWVIYGAVAVVLFDELFRSVGERDFISLGIGLFLTGILFGVGRVIESWVGSACLNPAVMWFEGAPKTYRNVNSRIKLGQDWAPARVRKLDEKGMFLFLHEPIALARGQSVEFEIELDGAPIQGNAKVTAVFNGEIFGLGLQFLAKDLYHFSQYTALVQQLRGRGL